MEYSLSDQFILPVVEPRTQNSKSSILLFFLESVVNCTAKGFFIPNSVGPFNNGLPSPIVFVVSPKGDCPITISAISPNLTFRHSLITAPSPNSPKSPDLTPALPLTARQTPPANSQTVL